MKKYDVVVREHNFRIYDYEDGLKPEIYYVGNDNVLYDEGNGFPSTDITIAYLHVYDFWEELINKN